MKEETQPPTDPKYSYEEVNANYAVSNHTAEWINIHKSVQSLWSEIYDLIYSEDPEIIDERFDAEFTPHLLALLTSLEKGISNSVITALSETKDSKTL